MQVPPTLTGSDKCKRGTMGKTMMGGGGGNSSWCGFLQCSAISCRVRSNIKKHVFIYAFIKRVICPEVPERFTNILQWADSTRTAVDVYGTGA